VHAVLRPHVEAQRLAAGPEREQVVDQAVEALRAGARGGKRNEQQYPDNEGQRAGTHAHSGE
jgi:hypothetical protein